MNALHCRLKRAAVVLIGVRGRACRADHLSSAPWSWIQEGTDLIVRVWRGWTGAKDGHHYYEHHHNEVLPALRQMAGFRGARLLRRTVVDETEFVSLTFFDDIETIRGSAGTDYETAVVADEARRVLARFDDRAVHYDVSAAV